MIVKHLHRDALTELLSTRGIYLNTGAFRTHVRTNVKAFVQQLADLYAEFPVEIEESIWDFSVRIATPSRLRSVFRPQVSAYIGDEDPFEPMPRALAMPLFESALNWCVAGETHRHLLLHAGVVAKNGKAAILPAPSGSGKSTLSAFLTLSGWRLLSDEFGIISINDGRVLGNPRPISLKNESIAELSEFGADAYLSPTFEGTAKGNVAFIRPFGPSVADLSEPCVPALVVFPSFERDTDLKLERVQKAKAFHRIVQNSANYLMHRRNGFAAVSELVERCAAFELRYSNCRDAIDAMEDLLTASTDAKVLVRA